MKSKQSAQWRIELTNEQFMQFNRVRCTTVRIWLKGAGVYLDGTANITVQMQTSGNYQDRIVSQKTGASQPQDLQTFLFSSVGMDEAFVYDVTAESANADFSFGKGLYGRVVVDGKLENAGDYFEPTPFTFWRIKIGASPTAVDFSKVTGIVMQFSGSTIVGS